MLFTISGMAQDVVPDKPAAWVNDYANVLSAGELRALDQQLAGLEQRSSNQIFIAIFNQLPENAYVEDFTVKLYEKWRPGLADKDNGILIAVFVADRKVRMEIGYGLEDVVTDAQAGMLIRDVIGPEFKQENYFAGLDAVIKILIPTVEGKYKLPVPKKEKKGIPFSMMVVAFFLFIFLTRIFRGPRATGYGTHTRSGGLAGPFIFGGFGGSRSSGGGFGGGFSGGFGGMSGGGGASGSW